MFLKIDYGSHNKFKTQALSSIPEMEEERMIKLGLPVWKF